MISRMIMINISEINQKLNTTEITFTFSEIDRNLLTFIA